MPSPYGEEDARALVRGGERLHAFAVVEAATDKLLGAVEFKGTHRDVYVSALLADDI